MFDELLQQYQCDVKKGVCRLYKRKRKRQGLKLMSVYRKFVYWTKKIIKKGMLLFIIVKSYPESKKKVNKSFASI